MTRRIGFLLNPVAGMGGRVGLKGTDGVLAEAIRRGARPVAPDRAARALARLRTLADEAGTPDGIRWFTAGGPMGEDALRAAGFTDIDTVYDPPAGSAATDRPGQQGPGKDGPATTGTQDTVEAARRLVAVPVDLILFCGGDGTARDICGVAGTATPILGIPSGVKMFSGVFATTPDHAADILRDWIGGALATGPAEVLDLDEEKYRGGDWAVRHYHTAQTPVSPEFVQAAKSIGHGTGEADAKAGIAAYVREELDAPGRLILLGAGTTVEAIGAAYGIDKTLLGIDAVADGRQVGRDLDERGLLDLLARYSDRRLVLSPIGAQGFVLGRGNLQIGPQAIRLIGRANIVLVATPAKIAATPVLRFDTGDPALDAELCGDGWLPVVAGYRFRKRVKAAA